MVIEVTRPFDGEELKQFFDILKTIKKPEHVFMTAKLSKYSFRNDQSPFILDPEAPAKLFRTDQVLVFEDLDEFYNWTEDLRIRYDKINSAYSDDEDGKYPTFSLKKLEFEYGYGNKVTLKGLGKISMKLRNFEGWEELCTFATPRGGYTTIGNE